jgi:flagellar hook assembly protein FlgD
MEITRRLVRSPLTSIIGLVALLAATLAVGASPANAGPQEDSEFSSYITVANKTFYPQVREGYRDNVTVTVENYGQYENVRASVVNSKNVTVRKALPVSGRGDGRDVLTWNGRKSDGSMAPKGSYRIVLTAYDYFYDMSVTARKAVTLDGGYQTLRAAESRKGTQTTSRAKTKSCYVRNWGGGTLQLDCWGGKYAKATWRIKIPAKATKVSYAVKGDNSKYGLPGKSTTTGKRINKKTYVVTAKITDWRSRYVDSVRVNYTLRVQR